jgi:hypothetical protein
MSYRLSELHGEVDSIQTSLTINVPVVYMVRDEMILMPENPFRGPLKGVDPENRDLFWALKWQRAKRVPFVPKKVEKAA